MRWHPGPLENNPPSSLDAPGGLQRPEMPSRPYSRRGEEGGVPLALLLSPYLSSGEQIGGREPSLPPGFYAEWGGSGVGGRRILERWGWFSNLKRMDRQTAEAVSTEDNHKAEKAGPGWSG